MPKKGSSRLSATSAAPRSSRSLRARPVDDPTAQRQTRFGGAAGERDIPKDELDAAHHNLGPEGTKARREQLVQDREAELRKLVEDHDMAIKEKFHLERYVSILEGWNPTEARNDNSSVFMEYKDLNYNLLELVPSTVVSQSATAGPSRSRARPLGPARTTRRQLQERSEALGHVTTMVNESRLPPPSTSKPNVRPPEPQPAPPLSPVSVEAPVAGKGRRRASEATSTEPMAVVGKRKGRASMPAAAEGAGSREGPSRPSRKTAALESAAAILAEMPPPPVPKGRKGGRRATIHDVEIAEPPLGGPITDEQAAGPKGKRRSRQSLPSLPAKKARLKDKTVSPSPASSPAPTPTPARSPSPTASPAPALPSLSHLPFPPPPNRTYPRHSGSSRIIYTDPGQRPALQPKHGGDLTPLLESYIHLEDTGPQPDLKTLEQRALREGYILNRVNYLQHEGRLSRLLDQEDSPTVSTKASSHQKKVQTGLPPRQTDFHDSLMVHMVQVRNAMMSEAKIKPQVCKKIARMIQLHWEHIEGKEERERLAEERERKRKGKEMIRGLRKRWGLAIKIVRARHVAAQKQEQDRLGKEHLQNMLQRSTGLLEAQRGDIVGKTSEDDEDAASDATDPNMSATEERDEASDEDRTEGADEGPKKQEPTAKASQRDIGKSVNDGQSGKMAGLESKLDCSSAPPENDSCGGEATLQERAQVNSQDSAVAERSARTSVAVAPGGQDQDGAPEAAARTQTQNTTSSKISKSAASTTVPIGIAQEPELAFAHRSNGTMQDSTPAPDDSEGALPPPRPPSRRLRLKGNRQAKTAPAGAVDPDANDPEFSATDTNLDEKDARLDAQMEDAESDRGADSEDEGLLADANLPIEDLLKRYGYSVPSPANGEEGEKEGQEAAGNDAPRAEMEAVASTVTGDVTVKVAVGSTSDEPVEATSQPLGDAATGSGVLGKSSGPVAPADQSLTDAALAQRAGENSLIIEGKRQRRPRTIWSPVETSPRKKLKVQEVAPKPEEPDEDKGDGDEEDEDEEEDEGDETDQGDETDEEDSNDGEDEEEDGEASEGGEAISADGEAEQPRLRPPFLLRGTLRPYQHAGLEWLASLYSNNMNGILADEMGLGKTIQTISLLGHLACNKGVWGQHLIIVPTSVILNWEMEFKKFLPGMKVLTYYGNQKERKEKRVGWNTENSWQVCITSYQIVLADQHIFRRKHWVYLILDEAHNIKNFRSQRWQTLLGFKTQRRLLLTGTPLQNNLMELWSLLYFLMPNGVTADATAVVGFANHRDFMDWFSNPMDKAVESGDIMDDDMIETVQKLHTLLRPFILRRLKSEVEHELPGKFEHVVYCRLSKRQRFLYDEFMSRASTRDAILSGGYLGVVNTLMQLRKVCNHPDLFEVRPVRTSLAMERGVVGEFEPTELLIRRRLLKEADDMVDLEGLNLVITGRENESGWVAAKRSQLDASEKLPYAIEPVKKGGRPKSGPKPNFRTLEGWTKYREHLGHEATVARWRSMRDANRFRCQSGPLYGSTTLAMLSSIPDYLLPESAEVRRRMDMFGEHLPPAAVLVRSYVDRVCDVTPVLDRFTIIPPNAVVRDVARLALPGMDPAHPTLRDPEFDSLHFPTVKLQIAFPDVGLLQYDCGKLQKLAEMLRDLKANGHRVLIFTQMTRVLDILEIFLSYNGHRYLRLDGSTKIEDRQVITERFNSDPRVFCFIASSRSGGVGINLTGADTVFFYDSDWNPSMDRQCMDRAHRIGQTREVHIYRFVSTHTVEENMLKKANQKRLLDRMVIQEGDFTTEFFGRMDWRDMLDDGVKGAVGGTEEVRDGDRIEDVEVEASPEAEEAADAKPRLGRERDLAMALAQVEDEEDAAAARVAQGEGEMDFAEFGGDDGGGKKRASRQATSVAVSRVSTERPDDSGTGTATPMPEPVGEEDEGEYDDEDEPGAVDEYMLRLVEWDWDYFSSL